MASESEPPVELSTMGNRAADSNVDRPTEERASLVSEIVQSVKSATETAFAENLAPFLEMKLEPLTALVSGFGASISVVQERCTSMVADMKTMDASLSTATTAITTLAEENGKLKAENEAFSQQIRALVARVEALEREVRDPVAVLYGVPEEDEQGGSRPDQPHAVESLVERTPSSGLVEVRRLGRSVAGARHPRPILLRFASVAHRNAAFKKAKALRANSEA